MEFLELFPERAELVADGVLQLGDAAVDAGERVNAVRDAFLVEERGDGGGVQTHGLELRFLLAALLPFPFDGRDGAELRLGEDGFASARGLTRWRPGEPLHQAAFTLRELRELRLVLRELRPPRGRGDAHAASSPSRSSSAASFAASKAARSSSDMVR